MTKKTSFAALVIVLLVVMSFVVSNPGRAYANASSPQRPLNLFCSTQCFSFGYWNGTMHGAMTRTIVDNPGLSIGDSYEKYIDLQGSGDTVYVGIANGSFCSFGSIQYFYAIYSSSGNPLYSNCFGVAKYDINTYTTFGVSFYASNGGGTFVWINNTFSGDDYCNPCGFPTGSAGEQWNRITLFVTVSALVTGHLVWGGDWYANQWFSGSAWNYQTRNFDYRRHNDPPQFYWYHVPAPGNVGGDLYSCVYLPGTTTCNFGS